MLALPAIGGNGCEHLESIKRPPLWGRNLKASELEGRDTDGGSCS